MAAQKRLSAEQLQLLALAYNDVPYVIFDMEMTGGNPCKNGIIEIYALRYRRGEVEGEHYHQLINPQMPIPPIVRRMTGVSDKMVAHAPTVDEAFEGFLDYIGSAVLVAHNIQSDLKFIQHYAQQVVGRGIDNFYLCTHILAQQLIAESPKKSLGGLCDHLGCKAHRHHRAASDTLMTLQLFEELQRRFPQAQLQSLEDLLRLQKDLHTLQRIGWSVSAADLARVPPKPGLFWLYDRQEQLLVKGRSAQLHRDIHSLSLCSELSRSEQRKVLQAHELRWEVSHHFLSALIQDSAPAKDVAASLSSQAFEWVAPSYTLKVLQAIPVPLRAKQWDSRRKKGKAASSLQQRYAITLAAPKPEALWMLGPVTHREFGQLWLKELAALWHLPYHKKRGTVMVGEQDAHAILRLFLSTSQPTRRSASGLKVPQWLRGVVKPLKESKSHGAGAKHLPPLQESWRDLSDLWGVVCVPAASVGPSLEHKEQKNAEDDSGGLMIYPLHAGELQLPVQYRGSWRSWKRSTEGRRSVREMKQHSRSRIRKARGGCARKLNVGLWVVTRPAGHSDLDRAYYVPLDALILWSEF